VKALHLVLLALLVLVPVTEMQVDRRLGRFRAQEEVLYLWSGEKLRRLAPGFEDFLADVYWLRTVQYFGGQRLFSREKRFDLLQPLIDITVALDPRLDIAYRYGAIFLSEPWPVGAGRPQAGVALLHRGAEANPSAWRLRQQEGYFTFFFLKDPKKAADILFAATEIPGSPFWLKTLAGDILLQDKDPKLARQVWQHLLEQSEEGILRDNARLRLALLDAQDQAAVLMRGIQDFEKARGRKPASLDELRSAGFAKVPVVDSQGVPFNYKPETGEVNVSPASRLWRPEVGT
jgi:hypothetical protein